MAWFIASGVIILLLLIVNAEAVKQCDPGQYGASCELPCPLHCTPLQGPTIRECDRDTGRCFEGCVPGWYGDYCNRTCSKNCMNNTCNQDDAHCTLGCKEKHLGDFCSEVLNADGLGRCIYGHYGASCDKSCPPHCAPQCGRTIRECERDTGECYEGCVAGWYGNLCNLKCSKTCKNNICNQDNAHCTLGCKEKYFGDFCNEDIKPKCDGDTSCWCTITSSITIVICVFQLCFTIIRAWNSMDSIHKCCIVSVLLIIILCACCIPHVKKCQPHEPTKATSRELQTQKSETHRRLHKRALLTREGCNLKADSNLRVASMVGNLEEVSRILAEGQADVNCKGWFMMTPVMLAAEYGHREVLQFLLSKGADVSQVDGVRNNILHLACLGGHLETVKFVLSQKLSDINSRDREGMTPVMEAAVYGNREVVKLLVSEGADLSLANREGNNILHVAANRGDVEVLKFVLSKHVVDINVRNTKGNTAADMARQVGYNDLANLLVP